MTEPQNHIRRIVTGHSESGESVVVSDTIIEGITLGGGKNFIKIWGNDTMPIHPDNGTMPESLDWFPKPGGHRFFVWVVPPKHENMGELKTQSEIDELLPGFLKHFEPENPGMHTSDSVDCTYLISGFITLELDNDKKVDMSPGDSVVQNGTRHRWHNHSTIPAVLITTSIGSKRELK
ncbi:MAG: cupin domain-containing protein [Prolixibacteraceae bacterium]